MSTPFDKEEALQKATEALSPRELAAYNYWIGKNEPPIAPSTQAKFFALFLAGNDTEEIRRLNQNFSLGMIVHARVAGQWDERRQEHIAKLLGGVRERVQQVTLESINHLSDMLSAHNKLQGDRIKRFLQSGDQSELKDVSIGSLKTYKETIELLLKLTGQDKQQTIRHQGEVVVSSGIDNKTTLKSEEAFQVLRLLNEKK